MAEKKFYALSLKSAQLALQKKTLECSTVGAKQVAGGNDGMMSLACQEFHEYLLELSRKRLGRFGEACSHQQLYEFFVRFDEFYRQKHRIIIPGDNYVQTFLNWLADNVAVMAQLLFDITPEAAQSVQHNYVVFMRKKQKG